MPGSAGEAAAETERPRGGCYVLAHQAVWAALVTFGPALDFQASNSGACMRVVTMRHQLLGLQNDFHPRMATLGLAGGFLPRDNSFGACRRVSPQNNGMSGLSFQRGSSGGGKRFFPGC